MAKHNKDPRQFTEDEIRASMKAFIDLHGDDNHLAPKLTTVELTHLIWLSERSVPGGSATMDVVQHFDVGAVVPAIMRVIYSMGYMRALEDLRQERVSI